MHKRKTALNCKITKERLTNRKILRDYKRAARSENKRANKKTRQRNKSKKKARE